MSADRTGRMARLLWAALAAALLLAVAVRLPDWYRRAHHPLKYEAAIAAAADKYGLDPYLIAAVINTESGFKRDDVSKKGAVGLMQLMPETAEEARRTSRLEVPADTESLRDPDVNIQLGSHHLGKLMDRYEEPEWALAAYNAGATNADRWRREATASPDVDDIGFPVTREYVTTVLREQEEYRKLYPNAFGAAAGK